MKGTAKTPPANAPMAMSHVATGVVNPGVARYGVMLGTGLVIAIVVEWAAIHWLHRWSYTAQMPLIPGLEIGVTPVLQMLVLPP